MIGVPTFALEAQYPLPLMSYMPIDILAYKVGRNVQGKVGLLGRTMRLGASPSRSATPWASPLGVMGSFELRGVHQLASPTRSIGTTPLDHSTR